MFLVGNGNLGRKKKIHTDRNFMFNQQLISK